MKNILIKTPRLGIILWNSSFPFSHFPHSVNSVASVSSYPQRGLLPGRSNHFQQQTQGIGATCHTVPVTTNDYQCIQAGCQCAGLGIARGCWGTWWRWGERAPPTQRFSSVVGAIKPNVTSPRSRQRLRHHVPEDEIDRLQDARSDTLHVDVCLI